MLLQFIHDKCRVKWRELGLSPSFKGLKVLTSSVMCTSVNLSILAVIVSLITHNIEKVKIIL